LIRSAKAAPAPYRRAIDNTECFIKFNLMVSADCEPTTALRASQSDLPNGMWCTMREEFASYSFLAVTVASLVLLCSGLLALTFS
jgi:hypothetical protein